MCGGEKKRGKKGKRRRKKCGSVWRIEKEGKKKEKKEEEGNGITIFLQYFYNKF